MGKNSERRLEKQRRIVDAVVDLMDEQGLKNVSVLEICAAANMSVGAFYNCFPSKEHIVTVMYAQLCTYMAELCAGKLAHMAAQEAIIAFFDEYAAYVTQWGVHANRLTAKNALDGRDDYAQHRNRLYDLLYVIVARGLDSGELVFAHPADVLTDQLFILVRGCNFEWVKRESAFPYSSYVHNMVTVFTSSIQATSTKNESYK